MEVDFLWSQGAELCQLEAMGQSQGGRSEFSVRETLEDLELAVLRAVYCERAPPTVEVSKLEPGGL